MTIDEIRDRITELRAAAVQRIERAENDRAENEETITEADEAIRSAAQKGNRTAYNEAKREKAECEEARQYFDAVIRQAKNTPTISREEYEALYIDISSRISEKRSAAREEMREAVEAIEGITAKYSRDEREVNAILTALEELPKAINAETSGYFKVGRITILPDNADTIGKMKERLR